MTDESAYDDLNRRLEALQTRMDEQIRLVNAILDLRKLSELSDLLLINWKQSLINLGVPVNAVSMQFPSTNPGHFVSHKVVLDGKPEAGAEDLLADSPWIEEAWESGKPVMISRAQFGVLAEKFPPEIQYILEVPLPGNKASVGVNTVEPEPFSEEAVDIVLAFAGLLSIGLQRVYDFETLERQKEDLMRSNKDLEQFAYIASHDLQEPLRMVTSYLQLLVRRNQDNLDSDSHEFINFAVDGASRMQTLISDLLTYSRVGTQEKPIAPTDIQEVVRKVLGDLKSVIEASNTTITTGDLPVINSDAGHMGQVFQNLIGNAIKFHNERPPKIHIDAGYADGFWEFSIRDNGIGIEKEYQERIFEVFQKLHTREVYSGTGIGLAICKKIVERHGGGIRLDSVPGQGTTFYFTVPGTLS